MRRRLLLLSAVVVLTFALAVGIGAAFARNPVSRSAAGSVAPKAPNFPPDLIVVSRSGYGSGTVTSVPAGIECGRTCSHQYAPDQAVTLTATPAPRSTFGGWAVSRARPDRGTVLMPGLCPGTSKCRLYASQDPAVVHATFIGHCVVPRVVGEKLVVAKRSIISRGCIVGRITHADSQTIKKGRVLSQTPTQGKWLTQWAKVNLAISNG